MEFSTNQKQWNLIVGENRIFEIGKDYQMIYKNDFAFCEYEKLFSNLKWKEKAINEYGIIHLQKWLEFIFYENESKDRDSILQCGNIIWHKC